MITHWIVAAGVALAVGGAVTACSPTTEKDAPATNTSTSAPASSSASSAPAVSPTEKAITPGGDNSFSPTVNPAQPGSVCNEIVNGVCVR